MMDKRILWSVPVVAVVVTLLAAAFIAVHPVKAGTPTAACPDGSNTLPCNDVPVYGIEMRAIAAHLAANPKPDYTPLAVDEKKLFQHAFRKVLKETDVYDAPGSNTVVGHIDNGFTFVNAGTEKDGYVNIRPNQWLPKDTLGPPNKAVSKFSGVPLPDGLPSQQFGWMVLDTKPSPAPGAKPIPGTRTIPHYTLLNFYWSELFGGWARYLIGSD